MTHTTTGIQQHFHLLIIKNMDLETVPHLATPIKEKSQKGLQNDSQETPQMDPKVNKNGLLDLQVPGWCPFGIQDYQNGHSGHQNGLKVSQMMIFDVKSDPAQRSTSQQLPAAKGAGGRGEALKIKSLVCI